MNTSLNAHTGASNPIEVDNFISDMISHLQADQFMFQTGSVGEETRQTYNLFCSQDHNQINDFARKISSGHFIRKVITDFMVGLKESCEMPEKIAFSFSDSKVSAWIEIKDDDEKNENCIYLIESKINANYEQYNFGILVTVVEESDRIPVPSKYMILPNAIF